jgi:hypothetical protein
MIENMTNNKGETHDVGEQALKGTSIKRGKRVPQNK